MLSTKTIRVAFALVLLVAPGVFTLAIGIGPWGVSISETIGGVTSGVGIEMTGHITFDVLPFIVSAAVSISGLVLLLRQMRRT